MESSNTPTQPEGLADDFFEQILSVPNDDTSTFIGGGSHEVGTMALQLGFGSVGTGYGSGNVNGFRGMDIGMPLGLNLEHGGFLKPEEVDVDGSSSMSTSRMNGRDSMHLTNLFPAFGHSQTQSIPPPPPPPSQHPQPFHGQPVSGMVAAAQHPSTIRPRVRARRGQATDPHSIAERLRRERIAERMRALQELVPCVSKTDRAAMLDETVDYVKFLRLQVKILSMSRLGGAGAVAHHVAGIPPEGDDTDGGSKQPAWEKWLNDGTEQQVAKLMEEDVGAAMQFIQSKALCIMPMSLAVAIFRTHQPDAPTIVKPEYDPRS